MAGKVRDLEKERYWQDQISGRAASGVSIREYCLRHGLKESRFHWWQRTLKERAKGSFEAGMEASFALVSQGFGSTHGNGAGIELLLTNGRCLRIGRGVDEQTLRTVLSVAEET